MAAQHGCGERGVVEADALLSLERFIWVGYVARFAAQLFSLCVVVNHVVFDPTVDEPQCIALVLRIARELCALATTALEAS